MKREFLDAMSRAAATVSVVTTDGPAGRAGVTVSAMTSVSADTPTPSLLVCVHHLSPAAGAIKANGVFCINLLREDQAHVSDTFAGRIKGRDKFDCAEWLPSATGSPVLANGLAAFDCLLKMHFQYGSHWIFIGELAGIEVQKPGNPLVYANRAYGIPVQLRPVPPAAENGDARPMLRVGVFSTLAPYLMPALVARLAAARPDLRVEIEEGDQEVLKAALDRGAVACAVLYDMDLDGRFAAEFLADVPPYVLLPQDHPLAASGRIRLADLVEEPMVLLDLPPSRDYFVGLFREAGLEPRIGHRVRSFETVRGLVGHGFGYAVLGTKPANAMTYDGRALATARIVDPVRPSRLVVASLRGRAPDPAAAAFMALCRSFFGAA
ncbi:MAG TPA: LysR substrate-binding domain-containing protein [Beijerinckiaceae bacterium]|nr:LysR substrate-binding domain-containing protein [Beijerinckiaceae bacterium]